MAPKYKGDADSWLGDEKNAQGRGRVKKQKGFITKAQALSWDEGNARVAEVFPNLCRITPVEGPDVLCSYRKVGLLGPSETRERSPVAVGDQVLFERLGDRGIVKGVCERRNSLVRIAPGVEAGQPNHGHRVHVIAANVQKLVIVAAVKNPEFNALIVDRFLVAAEAAGIAPILCINKIDLLEAPDAVHPWSHYSALGYPVIEVSLKKNLGLETLATSAGDGDVVFCGHSGVGKTSLLTHYLGPQVGRVAEVSELTGLGRHTTSSSIRYRRTETIGWIDTPGVREFSLAGVTAQTLAQHFPELRALACAQNACLHQDEEGCLARTLPRYTSYLKILNSL